MTGAERSRMVYLCDALEGAPKKALRLLALASSSELSERGSEIIARLHVAAQRATVLEEVKTLRRELR